MIAFSFETITHQEAVRILAEHDEAIERGEITNRPRKPAAVKRYAGDMQAGMWNPETAETLKFESHDKLLHGKNLIDGQNRLQAAVVSGAEFSMYVARGVAREAFAYIDGGEKRDLRDVLRISGEPDAQLLTPALKWLGQWDHDTGRLSSVKPSTQRARRILEADPAIRKSVNKAKAVKDSALLGVGIAAFLHRIFSRHAPALADQFIDAIASGVNLKETDPFWLLRQRLIENKGSRRKHPSRDVVAMAIKAWNAKREGRTLKLLRYNHRDEFPVLESAEATRHDVDEGGSASAENHANA